MDASRFDAWTRRRFGLAAAGGLAALLALVNGDQLDAKNKHKKKKRRRRRNAQATTPGPNTICKALGALCDAGVTATCCSGLTCGKPYDLYDKAPHYCCYQDGGGPCSIYNDCCYPSYCSGNVCVTNSDRDLKANVASIDPADMLARVAALPIATWNYSSDDPAIRHIGPMAQDFAATFGVGADDRHIHPIDGQGVALAAIQGLAAEVDRLREENARLAARLEALEQSRH